jgi:hypothetical protein
MFMLVYFYVTKIRLCTVDSWAVNLLLFEMNVEGGPGCARKY